MAELELKASKTKKVYWLNAHSPLVLKSTSTDLKCGIGKWQIFESRKNIDQTWPKIKAATESGQLTDLGAKVSTRKKKPVEIGGGTNEHVICVYTRDTPEHKAEVRAALNGLGFIRHLPYKSDADTAVGNYTTKLRPDTNTHKDSLALILESDDHDHDIQQDQPDNEPAPSSSSISYRKRPSNSQSESPSKKWTPPTGNPIKVYVTDNSAYRFNNAQRYIHIQQLYPPPFSNPPDVLFPIQYFRQVTQAFYELSNTCPTPEGSNDKIVVLEGKDVPITIWGERVSQFDGEFVIVLQHKKNKKKTMFLQSDGMFCYKRLEWFRTRPDIEGEDVFSSDSSEEDSDSVDSFLVEKESDSKSEGKQDQNEGENDDSD